MSLKSVNHYFFSIVLSVLVLILCNCSKDEDSINFPELLDNSITSFNVSIEDSIHINFTDRFRGFNTIHYLKSTLLFIPKIKSVLLDELPFEMQIENNEFTVWLTVWPTELFPSNTEHLLSIEIDWYDTDSVLVETVVHEYSIIVGANSFPIETIKATYPVDRQYYFLKNEYDKCFIYLERLPVSISDLSVEWYNSNDEIIHTSPMIKNNDKQRLEFAQPDLENEQIYAIEISQGTSLLKHIDFRTSKYNTFEEKMGNFSVIPQARLVSYYNKYKSHSLVQEVSISIEGFDHAEAKYDSVNMYYESGSPVFNGDVVPYSSGLVQVVFNPQNNVWFNEYVQPLIYAPFPDYIYEFQGPAVLGDSLFNAMRFEFENELPYLTDSEISNAIANPFFESNFKIGNYVPFANYGEFVNLRNIIINVSGDNISRTPRVLQIINEHYKFVPDYGIYMYDLNYRLPDGTITTTETFTMLN